MNFIKRFHPEKWGYKFYLFTALLLLTINLFGPRGFIHWVLIHQELARLKAQELVLKENITNSQTQMTQFQKSDVARFRAIRDELGLLQKDETSVEFVEVQKP